MRFVRLSPEQMSSRLWFIIATVTLASTTSILSDTITLGSAGRDKAGRRAAPPVERGAVAADDVVKARISAAYGQLPLTFEANRGQTDPNVDFLARGRGYTLFLTTREAVLALAQEPPGDRDTADVKMRHDRSSPASASAEALSRRPAFAEASAGRPGPPRDQKLPSAVLRMTLVGANEDAEVVATDELPGTVNYFIGRDAARWRTGIPTYAKVAYREVYSGIDVVYYGNQRQLEYDFVVHPGSSPETVHLRFDGADRIEVDPNGELVLHVGGGVIRNGKPRVYQVVDGRHRQIPGGYVLQALSQVSFEVGNYDTSRSLVIDPTLIYSTYLGGSSIDQGFGIAIDRASNAYVTGRTTSTDFPTMPGGFDTTLNGSSDAFVTKLDATGSTLLYSTYLGGTSSDEGNGIAVDAAGNAYVTGFTVSTDFPTTPGAFDTTINGTSDVFVTKLNATGSAPLLYSTFLGGIIEM